MPRIEVVPALPAHLAPIAAAMRRADRREVWAAARASPTEALTVSLAASKLAWSGTVDGRPVCMFGAANPAVPGQPGLPWLLGTDDIDRHALAFLRRNRPMVAAMLAGFGSLANCVDARNTASIRWLGWLGFTIESAIPFGPFGLPFHPFHKRLPP